MSTTTNNHDKEFDLVTRSQEQLSQELVREHRSKMPDFQADIEAAPELDLYYALESAIRARATCGSYPPLTPEEQDGFYYRLRKALPQRGAGRYAQPGLHSTRDVRCLASLSPTP